MNDDKLISDLIADPEHGIAKIIDKYYSLVYAVVKSKLYNYTVDAEEVANDVFFEIYNKRESINLQGNTLKNFVCIIASRRAVDHYRKLCKQQSDELTEDISEETDVADGIIARQLLEEIKSLGKPDSELILRKYYLSQTNKEIARDMNMLANTVCKRLTRAEEKLQKILERKGFNYET
ncbi:MAG: sigma-70 family RNA polymerase sigma factor [Oscillospiraceae bacterium]|nr:sigma-70 family RNA polymerase sigma factor [Oscillospiraceae bacterium]